MREAWQNNLLMAGLIGLGGSAPVWVVFRRYDAYTDSPNRKDLPDWPFWVLVLYGFFPDASSAWRLAKKLCDELKRRQSVDLPNVRVTGEDEPRKMDRDHLRWQLNYQHGLGRLQTDCTWIEMRRFDSAAHAFNFLMFEYRERSRIEIPYAMANGDSLMEARHHLQRLPHINGLKHPANARTVQLLEMVTAPFQRALDYAKSIGIWVLHGGREILATELPAGYPRPQEGEDEESFQERYDKWRKDR